MVTSIVLFIPPPLSMFEHIRTDSKPGIASWLYILQIIQHLYNIYYMAVNVICMYVCDHSYLNTFINVDHTVLARRMVDEYAYEFDIYINIYKYLYIVQCTFCIPCFYYRPYVMLL